MCFRNRVLIISHITFRGDCRVQFCDNLSRNSCFQHTIEFRFPRHINITLSSRNTASSLSGISCRNGCVISLCVYTLAVFNYVVLHPWQSEKMRKDKNSYVRKYWLQFNLHAKHVQPRYARGSSTWSSPVLASRRNEMFARLKDLFVLYVCSEVRVACQGKRISSLPITLWKCEKWLCSFNASVWFRVAQAIEMQPISQAWAKQDLFVFECNRDNPSVNNIVNNFGCVMRKDQDFDVWKHRI